MEDHESQSPSDLPRFEIPTDDSLSDSNFPPNIPPHLQNSSSLSAFDYISSAASSPSAAYAGLTIEGERSGDLSGSELRGFCAQTEQDTRSQSPLLPFSHRAIMGGAADLPQRSSSPLKRRASDLEAEVPPGQDVDMTEVHPSDPTDAATQSTRPRRAISVDMLREESEAEITDVTAQKPASPKPETGLLHPPHNTFSRSDSNSILAQIFRP